VGFEPSCYSCVRRDRDSGGVGDCPLLHRRQWEEQGPLKTKTVKQPVEEAWSDVYRAHPDGCTNWKPGDRRLHSQALAGQETLF